jgi:hypothetical protein
MVLIHRSDVVGVDLHFPNFSPPNSINFRPNLKIFEPVVVFFAKNRRVHLPGCWSTPAPATCSPRSISTFPIRVRVLAWSHPPPVNPSPPPSSVPCRRTRAQAKPRPLFPKPRRPPAALSGPASVRPRSFSSFQAPPGQLDPPPPCSHAHASAHQLARLSAHHKRTSNRSALGLVPAPRTHSQASLVRADPPKEFLPRINSRPRASFQPSISLCNRAHSAAGPASLARLPAGQLPLLTSSRRITLSRPHARSTGLHTRPPG